MPASISQYVLKVHSRCDLSCDHCYVYKHADQSWRTKPRVLAEETATQIATRIADHAASHQLDEVHVVLHGGEPLLLGYDGLRATLTTLRSVIDPVTRLDLRIHTNGVLLDEKLCELFADYGVKVGVSLDGDRAANDRHRRFPDGRSSYPEVLRALALLRRPEFQHLYSGILCTVDLNNDPVAVYEALIAEAPPCLDLLLPHATWDQPPPRPGGVHTPYAAWLGQIHARWVADKRPVPIRLFDSLLAAWHGGPSGSEAVGLDPVDLLVIETGGDWEQTDSLKTAFDGAAATGLNVFTHSVDEAAAHPGVAVRRRGLSGLSVTCRSCSLVRACGGGLYAHRYRSPNGFNNPSVYCDDLKVLIPQVTEMPKAAPAARAPIAGPATGHVLPAGAFDALSAGPGDAGAIASLLETRISITRALLATVAAGLGSAKGALGSAAAEGWALLARLDVEQPAAVREICAYPFTQAWAARCLRPPKDADHDLDRAHLAGLAAAAALRAGIAVEIALPVRDGSLYLPTFGAFTVGTTAGSTSVLRLSPGELGSLHGALDWQPVRRVSSAGRSVTVEDIDPFRDCYEWPVAGRLSDGKWRAWRLALTAAIQQLARQVPAYASVLRAGLRSVVPLRPDPAGDLRSGTARQIFGSVAVALPPDVDALAELLVHEMQHVKLAALLDLFDLFDPLDGSLHRVPWRGDLRPVEGVLHGTYAHLAIAGLWRSRAREAPDGEAGKHFQKYLSWVTQGMDVLASVGTLTPDGERFVAGMRATIEASADAQ